jgi:hypothetical protein
MAIENVQDENQLHFGGACWMTSMGKYLQIYSVVVIGISSSWMDLVEGGVQAEQFGSIPKFAGG